jgi:hypothetical protein
MSKRQSIVIALSEKFKEIDGTGKYNLNIFQNSYPKLKFWDEVQDFPSVYVSAGTGYREYLPSDFIWQYLNVSIKLYTRGEDDCLTQLEQLIEDVATCIDANRVLVFDKEKNLATTEILIQSIITDEGLLRPYGVGEINALVRYAL